MKTEEEVNEWHAQIKDQADRLKESDAELRAKIKDLEVALSEAKRELVTVIDGNRLLQEVRTWRRLGQLLNGWIQPHKNDLNVGQQADPNCKCEVCSGKREILAMLGNPL